MTSAIRKYMHWLHTQWPAGTVEKLPEVDGDGIGSVPGIAVVGDLTGVPLLKFALDSGARAVDSLVRDLGSSGAGDGVDLVIIGAGVSGMAAAKQALKHNLRFVLVEAAEPFFTISNFPKKKPIFTYPAEMDPHGDLKVQSDIKEDLVEELRRQTAEIDVRMGRAESVEGKIGRFRVRLAEGEPIACRRVIVAIGRSGDFRRLNIPGEGLPKVYNRLHDPQEFCGQKALVIGGGDSALETAAALARCGARVTLSYRKADFSRAKSENVQAVRSLAEVSSRRDPEGDLPVSEPGTAADASIPGPKEPGSVTLVLESTVKEISGDHVILENPQGKSKLENDVVFPMIGREPPLGFFRRTGIRLLGELSPRAWTGMAAFILFCAWLYNWKSGGWFAKVWDERGWFPTNLLSMMGDAASDPSSLLGIIGISVAGPAFWYTLAYSLLVVIFGVLRIKRRKTPYVKVQTLTLMTVQVIPLFLLPEIILPWLDKSGLLHSGIADSLFPQVNYGHGREFWRAYGFILAWPLNVYNVMTHEPLWAWIGIGFVQTFVLLPAAIYFFGKGVYCGWICSCGALAETLGDTFRQKMPHGPKWNRLNMLGQVILAAATVLLVFRILSWMFPEWVWLSRLNAVAKDGAGAGGIWSWFNYKWTVDVLLAGILGYGLYFWFSGRVWCRFACPLAALMHIYARFSRFRIFADKKKCISCNVCTTVCHQGIDVMNFANKGLPMQDPECVRCSACVQSCPTGVLTFGRVDGEGNAAAFDRLAASPVQIKEES